MGTSEIGIAEMSDVMLALKEYQRMSGWITQTTGTESKLKEWCTKYMEMYGDQGKYIGQEWYRGWRAIDIHIVNQTWGSTACRWGDIGGAAMTSAYTTCIVNYEMKIVCVYWSGRLAYIAELNDKIAKDWHMPGLGNTGKIDMIYKHPRK